jgi:glycerol-3-phosphate dehydrogenase
MRRDRDAFSQEFDVLVIGAGIHGACIARLAAKAGLRVALLEKGDFGGATSRNSAKLVHGGLRYIQHFDVPRIRESMLAQRAWFRFAPHLVRPLRFIIPTYGWTTRGPLALAGGMLAFHAIAAGRNDGVRPAIRLPRSGMIGRDRLLAAHPYLQRGDVTGGAYWYDGQLLDATRVTFECVRDAMEAGAAAANHLEAVSLLHGDRGVCGVAARDACSDREIEVRARLTINATGPWVDRLLATGPAALGRERVTAWTRNINLVTRKLYPGEEALGIASNRASDAALGKSKRLFFTSPWHGCSVVGTTHDLNEEDPDLLAAPDEIVAGFLQEVSDAAPGLGLAPEDVRSVHLGLTPAEDAASARAHRPHVIDHDAAHGVAGLVSVAGIKYTTAPVVAAKVVELACRKLRRAVRVPPFDEAGAGAPGGRLVLPREAMAAQADGAGRDGAGSEGAGADGESDEYDWARAIYGSRAAECLVGLARGEADSEQVFRHRVQFGIAREMVIRLPDAIFRATDWAERGLLTEAQLAWCATTMAATLGWSPRRTASELAATRAMLTKLHVKVRDPAPAYAAEAVNS